MKHIDYRDPFGGILMMALGLFVSTYANNHYTMGQPVSGGPGRFPLLPGLILAILGLIIALLAFRQTVHALKPPPFAWRALVAISAAILVFGLTPGRP
ncbi:MAG: hypothetical protein PHH58_10905 [Rhodoferax sp.]|nr:hypothetical protein [Rhodoferax sp.]